MFVSLCFTALHRNQRNGNFYFPKTKHIFLKMLCLLELNLPPNKLNRQLPWSNMELTIPFKKTIFRLRKQFFNIFKTSSLINPNQFIFIECKHSNIATCSSLLLIIANCSLRRNLPNYQKPSKQNQWPFGLVRFHCSSKAILDCVTGLFTV